MEITSYGIQQPACSQNSPTKLKCIHSVKSGRLLFTKIVCFSFSENNILSAGAFDMLFRVTIILMNNLIQFLSHFLLFTCCQGYSVCKFDSCNGLDALGLFLTPWFNPRPLKKIVKLKFHVVISRENCTLRVAVWTIDKLC